MKPLKYKVGDRLQLYRPAPEGVTATVLKLRPKSDSPYKVRMDTVNPFTGELPERWVSRAVVMGYEGETRTSAEQLRDLHRRTR